MTIEQFNAMLTIIPHISGRIETRYFCLENALHQQNVLIYIVLGLLGLVTVLVIASSLNQRKLKKELRQLRELIEAKAAQADGEEDKGNS